MNTKLHSPKLLAPKIAFIKAQWHSDIVDNSLTGFLDQINQSMPNATVDAFDVPGAFEMPLLAKKLAKTGKYDAIIASAFVVDGGIYHHEFVSAAVVNGLMDVQLETEVPVFSVSLTPHNYQETDVLTNFFKAHFVEKGKEAANAVEKVLSIDLGQLQNASAA
ncbi:MAG: riboflavin synthase subunit beta [Hyphomicrobiales bacterium]|nr:6,7-dimethyl-8-ribityllumazine synthase [Hyphomicrobiales bacterium]PCH49946.1 MAG: riboflavin synthase subunit beta [Hyphomicrobiales bacterium]